LNDSEGLALELRYLKTRSGKEIDFVLTDDKGNVSQFIECKLSDAALSYALKEAQTDHPAAQCIQLVHNLDHGSVDRGVYRMPASEWLNQLSV
jgi:hypothetical protein